MAGICEYQIKINSKDICKFVHDRKDGLSVCLYKAYKAVKEYQKAVKND